MLVSEEVKVREAILAKGRSRANAIVKDAEKRAEAIIAKARKQVEDYRRMEIEKLMKKIEAERIRRISSARFESRIKVLEEKNKIINSIFKDAVSHIVSNIRSLEWYPTFLRKIASASITTLGLKEVVVYASKEDLKLLMEMKDDVIEDVKRNLGFTPFITFKEANGLNIGVKVSSIDGSIAVDNSLETMLEKLRPKFIMLIAKTLFGE